MGIFFPAIGQNIAVFGSGRIGHKIDPGLPGEQGQLQRHLFDDRFADVNIASDNLFRGLLGTDIEVLSGGLEPTLPGGRVKPFKWALYAGFEWLECDPANLDDLGYQGAFEADQRAAFLDSQALLS